MHWSCGKRLNLEDLPSVKFAEVGNQESQKVKQEHWNCAATLCTNSWRTKKEQLKYYRLKEIAKCPEKRREYSKILKIKGTDFDHGFICSAHWSKGGREIIDDLPDLPCAPEFVETKDISSQENRVCQALFTTTVKGQRGKEKEGSLI